MVRIEFLKGGDVLRIKEDYVIRIESLKGGFLRDKRGEITYVVKILKAG